MEQIERVLLNDEGERTVVKDGELVRWFRCIGCGEYVIAKEEYKIQNVVCPFCKKKFKVRIYKNNTITLKERN